MKFARESGVPVLDYQPADTYVAVSYTHLKLVQTIKELQSELDALRSEGKTIGLVPTMGARCV